MSVRTTSSLLAGFAAALALVLLVTPSDADRRYFLTTYTPYLDEKGEHEVEYWFASRHGLDEKGTTPLAMRAEYERALTDRFTGAAYLNFNRESGEPLKFHSPSVEMICALGDPGRIAGDPALYFEATESGEELELEPRILFGHRFERWVAAANLTGELEFRHNDDELLASGEVMKNAFVGQISGGLAYRATQPLTLGAEARYRTEHPNFGPRSASFLSVGPTMNLEIGSMQLGVGALFQVSGTPATHGNLNLVDSERMQLRAMIGVEL